MDFIDGNFECGFSYTLIYYNLDLTRISFEKCNYIGAGIEPAALQFRCSALTN